VCVEENIGFMLFLWGWKGPFWLLINEPDLLVAGHVKSPASACGVK